MISVVIITARKEPRWKLMVDGLKASYRAWTVRPTRAHEPFPFPVELVVVDAMLWYDAGRRGVLAAEVADAFPLQHVAPKPSRWHGPHRDEAVAYEDRPDQPSARNTGLIHVRGDYVVFLDDCSYVSERFFEEAWVARSRGTLLIYPHAYVYRNVTKEDRAPLPPSYERRDPTCMRGSGVGYPLEALLDVNGCDEAYSGEPREDVELGIRVCRLLKQDPIATPRAWICEQKHDQADVYGPETRYGSARNEGLTSRLMGDAERDRTQPLGNDFNLRELRAKRIVP